MRTERVFTIRLTGDAATTLIPAVHDWLPGAGFGVGVYQVRFHHAPEVARRFQDTLEGLDIPYRLQEERTYSSDEIERAPALHFSTEVQVPVTAVAEIGVCCHLCESPMQTPELRLDDLDAQLPPIARSQRGDLIVDEALASALIREHIEGCLLRPVVDGEGRPTRLFELVPMHRLPPMHAPPTRFNHAAEDVCPHCGHGGLFLESPPFYDVPVDAFADVNMTYERFGRDEAIGPDILISQKLFRVIRDHKPAGVSVEPVIFI